MSSHNHSVKRVDSRDNTVVYVIVGLVLFFIISLTLHRYMPLFFAGWKILFTPIIEIIDVVARSVLGHVINPLLGTTDIQAHTLNQFVHDTSVNRWSAQGFMAMNHFVGKYLLIILFPMGLYATVFLFKKTQGVGGAFQRFKNSRLLNAYIRASETSRVNTTPVTDEAFEKDQSAALSCAEFCKKYQLITIDEKKETVSDLDVEAAFQVFQKQLGLRFTDKQSLFDGDYGWVAQRIVKQIPLAYRPEAIDYALDRHLYESTAVLSLLSTARRLGVVPIQLFLNVKHQNRALWYALASLGRKVAFVEGAGIVAQFNHEKINGALTHKTLTCRVDSAVDGLMQALIEESLSLVLQSDQSVWDYLDSEMTA